MITLQQYFGKWWNHSDVTDEIQANAERLLAACEHMESLSVADGIVFLNNPATGSGVSGVTFGGFRPQDCPQGAPHSAHKEGLAVDRFDPHNEIDAWCMDHEYILTECGIYIEDPSATKGWSHWSIKPPKSGKHVFMP
jgi:hypothetical protein